MDALETAGLAYLAAGVTCWLVLAIAYARRGVRSRAGFRQVLVKTAVALPVIVAWPLLLLALMRRESGSGVPGGGQLRE